MEFYDAIIVGAGPAGSTAAKNLATKGFKVLLLDKAKFPRDKVCAGGLTNIVIKQYPYLEKYTFNKYYIVQVFAAENPIPLRYGKLSGLGYQTTREYFDYMLLKEAIAAGTVFKESQRVIDVIVNSDKVQVKTDIDQFEGKIVLGADGDNSVVSRKSGINPVWKAKQIASQVRVQVEFPEEVIKQYSGEEYKITFHGKFKNTPGIGYIFSKRNHLNIGMCTQTPDRIPLKKLISEFIAEYQKKGILPEFECPNLEGAIYPIAGPLKKFISNRILLLGDAAGFVNPFDGEGIYQAIYSGDIAAKVTSDALHNNDFSEKFLNIYQKICMKSFGNYLRKAAKVSPFCWKYADIFVKYAPYSKNLVRLYEQTLKIHPTLYWTVFKLCICFIGAFIKYNLRRIHEIMPIVYV